MTLREREQRQAILTSTFDKDIYYMASSHKNWIIGLKQRCPTNSQEQWARDCAHEPIDWRAAYQPSFQCTRSTKLIVFQFKLPHRRLATNDFLKK